MENGSRSPHLDKMTTEGGEACTSDVSIPDNLNILAIDVELSVAQNAWNTILKLCRSGQGPVLDKLLSDDFLEPIETHAIETPNQEIKLRLLHSLVALGATSQRAFSRCEKRTFKHLVELYFSDDLLVKLNVIEIIREMGQSSFLGIEYLIKERVPQQFVKDISAESLLDTDARLGIVGLLVSIIQAAPALATELITACDGALPGCIEEFLLCPKASPDAEAMHLSGINSWGGICCCQEGLHALLKYGNLRSHIYEAVESTNNSISCAAMRAWTSVVSGNPKEMLPGEIVTALESSVVPRVLDILVRRPFVASREACYTLMTAMIEFDFAARALVKSANCLRVLLDCRSEDESPSMYAKHEMVKALLSRHSTWLRDVVDTCAVNSLEQYVKGGPFYTPQVVTADVDKQAAQ
eukprot:GHVS01015901.1.p1 GENE.GHVS01015901.1~~GHVS01015901.1.p1  ORF type:complete len:411 (-),score=24.37 GHVS01015901.1:30-1262(-)